MRKKIIPLLAIAILIPLGANAQLVPDAPRDDIEYNLTAAGATFPFPLIDLWRVEYNNIHDNVNLNYQSIGSGGGIKQHIEETVNFAASDKPMSESERLLAPGTLHIPESIGGVVLVYNIPEIPDKGLKLTADAVARIYLGEITKWNDPAIAMVNPELSLPDKEIVTAHRSDGSGTTFIFTDYLSVVSQKWHNDIGAGKSVPWTSGLAAAGNEGVAGIVKSTEYSIGYVELAYAFQTGMSFAFIENSEKTKFIEPTLESISAASSGIADTLPTAQDSWVGVSLVNAPGTDSYPIASFTYLLLYDDLKDVTDDIQQAKAVIHLIHWMITDGQAYSSSLLYVPLSDKVVEIGKQGLAQVTFDGQRLWSYGELTVPNDVKTCPSGESMIDGKCVADGGGCLIATAAFGTELAPQVQMLREIRDNTVLSTASGAAFMSGFNAIYYTFAPTVSDWQRENPVFKEMVRAFITPMISTLSIMELADDDSVLGLGISVIALNLGMYVMAPALVGIHICRRCKTS